MKKIITFLLLLSSNAFAGFQVGSSIYTLNNEQKTLKQSQQVNFNLGWSESIGNVFLTTGTNRLFTNTQLSVIDNKGYRITKETKAYVDSISAGYRIERFIPSLYLARVDSRTKAYMQKQVYQNRTISLIYGGALSYFLTKDIYGTVIFVAPETKQDLDASWGFSLTKTF